MDLPYISEVAYIENGVFPLYPSASTSAFPKWWIFFLGFFSYVFPSLSVLVISWESQIHQGEEKLV